MNFNKDIQHKLSGFEPEVPEEKIQENWEKIKYFLPEEEKKRGVFFFHKPKYMGMGALVSLLMFFAVYAFLTQYRLSSFAKPLKKSEQTALSLRIKQPILEKNNFTSTIPSPLTIHSDLPLIAITDHKKTALPFSTSSKKLINSFLPYHYKNSTSERESKVIEKSPLPGKREVLSDESKNLVLTDSSFLINDNQAFMLPLFKPSLSDTDVNIIFRPFDSLVKPLDVNRKFSLEFLTGTSYTSSDITYLQKQEDHKMHTSGFLIGLGANVYLKKRFFVTGQFIFVANKFAFQDNQTSNDIIKKETVPTGTIISVNSPVDTVISYLPYNSSFRITSNTKYHLSFGAGYTVFQKHRLWLDGTLLLDLKLLNYHSDYTIQQAQSDTAIIINTSNGNDPNVISFYQNTQNYTVHHRDTWKNTKTDLSVGLMPSLTLGYRITKNMDLIWKSSYGIDLSNTTIKLNNQTYQLKGTHLLMAIGWKYRF